MKSTMLQLKIYANSAHFLLKLEDNSLEMLSILGLALFSVDIMGLLLLVLVII
jgi:hypothetical protein